MTDPTEIELKFLVPAAARKGLLAELARGAAGAKRTTMSALYLDTPDRRLARAGIAWRVRREGRQWVQTVKGGGRHGLERLEHEVVRPDAQYDANLHRGTAIGDRLLSELRQAGRDGAQVGVRFGSDVRRVIRLLRTRGAMVEVAFDEGRLIVGDVVRPLCELEFELVSGNPIQLLALAQRWRQRHGLVYDPRSKAERGDRLADGLPAPALRKAQRPVVDAHATALEAYQAALDECLAQIARNAIGLVDGDPALRVDHVHQLRVGIRRLRSGLRSFEGWVPQAPAPLVDGLRALFGALGAVRDDDVLDSGVAAALARAGAPPPARTAQEAAKMSAAEIVAAPAAQEVVLGWLAWRLGLAAQAQPDDDAAVDAGAFRRGAQRRLRRWHRRIVEDADGFDALSEEALHSLRKRVKRQRYAVEFFAAVLDGRSVERYLKALTTVQECMGELNDLFVARAHYQAQDDPGAWFALGWIASRTQVVLALAREALGQLAQEASPVR